MDLRDYQTDALTAIDKALLSYRSALVVMPTGTGKTVLFSSLAKHWPEGRVLVLAHREELIRQAANKIEQTMGEPPDIEMADSRSVAGMWGGPKVVVASVQTLCRRSRLSRFDPLEFGLVICDEAHHDTPQNSTYYAIRNHFAQNPACRFVGVTATPDRNDKLAMGQNYETVAYDYSLVDAINDGYLTPIEQQYVVVDTLDFSACRTVAGDLNGADLAKVMDEPDVVHKVASSMIDIAGKEQAIIFTVDVAQAELIADVIRRQPGLSMQAECLHGGIDKDTRRAKLAAFAQRKFQFLVGCMLFTEGFDEPWISVVGIARPTKSRALYTQMVGRGTRTLTGLLTPGMTREERQAAIAGSAKPRCLVVDFVGNSGQHKLISTADILAGKHEPAAVLKAIESAQQSGRPVNMLSAIEQEQKAEEARQEREEAKRKEEEARSKAWATANYRSERIDPFGRHGKAGQAGFERPTKMATAEQIWWLTKNGKMDEAAAKAMTSADARKEIADRKRRWSAGLCSAKQESTLRRFGESGEIGKNKATALFALLKARGWKARDFKLTRDRWSITVHNGEYLPTITDSDGGKVVLWDVKHQSVDKCRDWIGECLESGSGSVAA
jgi:superfamily II DNA or RNA helicase